MNWKSAHRSFYYQGAPDPEDLRLPYAETAMLSIDVQIVVEDCCAAGTDELHYKELEIINMIYCHVVTSAELRQIMNLQASIA